MINVGPALALFCRRAITLRVAVRGLDVDGLATATFTDYPLRAHVVPAPAEVLARAPIEFRAKTAIVAVFRTPSVQVSAGDTFAYTPTATGVASDWLIVQVEDWAGVAGYVRALAVAQA